MRKPDQPDYAALERVYHQIQAGTDHAAPCARINGRTLTFAEDRALSVSLGELVMQHLYSHLRPWSWSARLFNRRTQ